MAMNYHRVYAIPPLTQNNDGPRPLLPSGPGRTEPPSSQEKISTSPDPTRMHARPKILATASRGRGSPKGESLDGLAPLTPGCELERYIRVICGARVRTCPHIWKEEVMGPPRAKRTIESSDQACPQCARRGPGGRDGFHPFPAAVWLGISPPRSLDFSSDLPTQIVPAFSNSIVSS